MTEMTLYLVLTDESLDEEGDGNDVEDKKEEDGLSVLLQEVDHGVPLLENPGAVPLGDRVQAETLHSDNSAKNGERDIMNNTVLL